MPRIASQARRSARAPDRLRDPQEMDDVLPVVPVPGEVGQGVTGFLKEAVELDPGVALDPGKVLPGRMPEDPPLAIDKEALEGVWCTGSSLDDRVQAGQFDV